MSYLTNKVDELTSSLLKSKMRVGELESINESLTMRLNDGSQLTLAEEIRQRVRKPDF